MVTHVAWCNKTSRQGVLLLEGWLRSSVDSPPYPREKSNTGEHYFLRTLSHWKSLKTFLRACMHAQLLQSCPTLCNPVDCSPPGSSVHGILQARILKWVITPSSRGSSQPRDPTSVSWISYLAGGFFTHWATWKQVKKQVKKRLFMEIY